MTRPLWIYKNNSRGHTHQWSTGDWREFYKLANGAQVVPWGNTAWMGSAAGRRAAFEMRDGDLVLCWQSDRRVAVGLATVVDQPGDWSESDGVAERQINLRPLQRFSPEAPLLDLRKTDPELAKVKGFRPGPVQSIYRTEQQEASAVLMACGLDPATVLGRSAARRQPSNKLVETAAINYVRSVYEAAGWSIRSVEADKIGYDLVAQRGSRERHLEVKGISGPIPRFILTANEHRSAGEDSRFRLCAVTSATIASKRKLHEWTGAELLRGARVAVVSYVVEMDPT